MGIDKINQISAISIDWDRVKRECPKAWAKCREFFTVGTWLGEFYEQGDWDARQLYDFFDSLGMCPYVEPIGINSKTFWFHNFEIPGEKKVRFDSRRECESVMFNRAFDTAEHFITDAEEKEESRKRANEKGWFNGWSEAIKKMDI